MKQDSKYVYKKTCTHVHVDGMLQKFIHVWMSWKGKKLLIKHSIHISSKLWASVSFASQGWHS